MKKLSLKFDQFIKEAGIGASLFFVLIMLIFVNAHSLNYLLNNWIFSIVGGIGFSLATTSVIRRPVSNWMKWSLPLFDMFLVFIGFNISDEYKFILTIIFSIFTGIILISLGTINFKENEEIGLESKLSVTMSKLKLLEERQTNFELYKKAYFASEKGRILKKKVENRTKEENLILNQKI
jgi:hypothetical protein